MTFKYREYDDLVKDIKLGIDSLLLTKSKKTKEEGFLTDEARYARVQGLKNEYPDRHKQTQYLLTIIESLDLLYEKETKQLEDLAKEFNTKEDLDIELKSKGREELAKALETKKIILNAATYYVYYQIEDSYQNGKLTYFLPKMFKPSATSSDFHGALYVSLNLGGGMPNEMQVYKMYDNLLKFIKSQVYHPEGLSEGFKPNHPFSEEKIIGYDLASDLKKLSTLVQQLENKISQKMIKEKKQENKFFFSKTLALVDDYANTSESKFEFKDDCEEFFWDFSYEHTEEQDEEGSQEVSHSASI